MKHRILITAAVLAGSFAQLMGSEQTLPIVESTVNWITVKHDFDVHGRRVPWTMCIRKDEIVSVSAEFQGIPQSLVDQPAQANDPEKIPVEIVINLKKEQMSFRIRGLNAKTSTNVMKDLLEALGAVQNHEGKEKSN